MGSAQVYEFLAASFLILTLLADSTAACYCLGRTLGLQTIYCASDVVAMGKFVNATLGDPVWYWGRYDFETSQVFKIPKTLEKVHSLYTQLWGSTCGYRHNGPFNDDEYIITGSLIENRVIIDLCSFIKPWDQLTRAQQRGLLMVYARRWSSVGATRQMCKINNCPNQCLLCSGPSLRNGLPEEIRKAPMLLAFCKLCETELFRRACLKGTRTTS